jgi:membrane protease YdiL (CAAX protease family)
MLILALELVGLSRHLGLRTKRDAGFGLPMDRFLKVSLVFGLIGIATASVGAAFLLVTHLRVSANSPFTASVPGMLRLLLIASSSGIAVALIEETVMRGVMHTAIEREAGPVTAALTTAPLFAILHFFAKARIPPEQVDWASGFDLVLRFFVPLSHPALVFDAFLAWLAVGLILSLTRVFTGNIAVAIGRHAGWVVVLRVLQETTVRGGGTAYSAWVGRFDGLLGYWLLPWAAAIGLALWLTRRAWVPYASGASLSRRSTGSSISR